MATCSTGAHLFGADDRCLHCGDPAPQIPEFLRGAREPDGRDAEIRRLTLALIEANQARLVPGVMRCAKCHFELTRVTLYMGNGAVRPGDSSTEPRPNGCGPLWPVTWEQRAREAMETAERFFDEKQEAVTKLTAALDEAAIHAVAWRALGYVVGKFPELLDVILGEWRALVALEERL